MVEHRFKVGEVVEVASRADPSLPSGRYKVLRVLPPDGADNQYRVQSLADRHERVVRESQLLRPGGA